MENNTSQYTAETTRCTLGWQIVHKAGISIGIMQTMLFLCALLLADIFWCCFDWQKEENVFRHPKINAKTAMDMV